MSIEREFLKKLRYTTHLENDLRKELEELLAQPEQEPTTRHALDSYWNQEAYQRGYAEAKLKLKRKPIEEGELEVWYSQHTWAMDKQEYMWGFRDAEQAHGIGGEE